MYICGAIFYSSNPSPLYACQAHLFRVWIFLWLKIRWNVMTCNWLTEDEEEVNVSTSADRLSTHKLDVHLQENDSYLAIIPSQQSLIDAKLNIKKNLFSSRIEWHIAPHSHCRVEREKIRYQNGDTHIWGYIQNLNRFSLNLVQIFLIIK